MNHSLSEINGSRTTLIVLARHGNTFEAEEEPRFVGSRTDIPLTPYGVGQAEEIARFLERSGFYPELVQCGSLARQCLTAEIVADRMGLESGISAGCPALQEIDYGPWENLTAAGIQKNWPDEFRDWNERGQWPRNVFRPAEEDFKSRVEEWLKETTAGSFRRVLAVTSNGVLRYIYNILQGRNALPAESKTATGRVCVIKTGEGASLPVILAWNHDPAKPLQINLIS